MKIVMVAPFAAYPKGTVPVRMLPLAKALVKQGHKVSIIAPPYDNPFESGREYEVDGVKLFNIRFQNLPLMKYPLATFEIFLKVLRLKPHVLYIFKPKGYSGLVCMVFITLRKLGLLRMLRLILDMDDWEGYGGFCDYYLKHRLYPKYMLDFFDFQERWIPRRVDIVTVASRVLRDRVLSWGIPSDRVLYIPNGAPQHSFDAQAREVEDLRMKLGLERIKVILLYTRFFEYRLGKLIDILKLVKREVKDVKLLVVGKGEFGEEKRLKVLAEREGLSDAIVFAGWIQPKDLPSYLAVGDVAIYPFDDTLLNRAKCPGKLVELMVAGKAIVADRVGQIAEYIQDGESGVLVDSDDVQAFASNVVKVLEDDALRRRLGKNARNRILDVFNWDKLTAKVEQALSFGNRKIIQNRKKACDPLKVQRDLELKIRRLLKEKAPIEELQKAYDELHSHILSYGIRDRPPLGYLYKGNLSLIDQLFLKKIGKEKSVLEIGVGDGHFLIACVRKGNFVKGLDISEAVIRRLKARLEKERLTAELKLGDARCLKFPDEVFDYVVSKDLIEHIPEEDLQLHLREVWRVLKPNGCYLIWTPSRLLGPTPLGAHLKEYLLAEVLSETSKAGFKPVVMNLYIYALFRMIKNIPSSTISCLIKYENMVEKFFQRVRMRVQHPLLYLIVPPICIAAHKKGNKSFFHVKRGNMFGY